MLVALFASAAVATAACGGASATDSDGGSEAGVESSPQPRESTAPIDDVPPEVPSDPPPLDPPSDPDGGAGTVDGGSDGGSVFVDGGRLAPGEGGAQAIEGECATSEGEFVLRETTCRAWVQTVTVNGRRLSVFTFTSVTPNTARGELSVLRAVVDGDALVPGATITTADFRTYDLHVEEVTGQRQFYAARKAFPASALRIQITQAGSRVTLSDRTTAIIVRGTFEANLVGVLPNGQPMGPEATPGTLAVRGRF
jgi:hypothetical protein